MSKNAKGQGRQIQSLTLKKHGMPGYVPCFLTEPPGGIKSGGCQGRPSIRHGLVWLAVLHPAANPTRTANGTNYNKLPSVSFAASCCKGT